MLIHSRAQLFSNIFLHLISPLVHLVCCHHHDLFKMWSQFFPQSARTSASLPVILTQPWLPFCQFPRGRPCSQLQASPLRVGRALQLRSRLFPSIQHLGRLWLCWPAGPPSISRDSLRCLQYNLRTPNSPCHLLFLQSPPVLPPVTGVSCTYPIYSLCCHTKCASFKAKHCVL